MNKGTQVDPSESVASNQRQPRSSRQRYLNFVQDYKRHRLDDHEKDGEEKKPEGESAEAGEDSAAQASPQQRRAKRREYLREYLRWLWPHRFGVAALFVFALLAAGLEMIEPLFMRFIIDRVLLNTTLDSSRRLSYLHGAGALFAGVVVLSHAISV